MIRSKEVVAKTDRTGKTLMTVASRAQRVARKADPEVLAMQAHKPKKNMVKTRKLLVIAHNHPQFFPGGAEILAYDLFKAVRDNSHYDPVFMAGVSQQDRLCHEAAAFQTLTEAEDELLFWGGTFDCLYQSNMILPFMYNDFKQFLLKFQPDVIHFHHTMRFGLEALVVARQVLPDVRIVYTLHEFILICNRDGQMVRKHNNALCNSASPAKCNRCFPEIPPALFRMREEFIKAHLEHVDLFISPSHFLANRFIDWGIEDDRIVMLENGRYIDPPAPFRSLEKSGKRNVFGYFGQINPYKGAMLTFKAVEYLVNNGFTDFRLEIFGNVELQEDDFKEDFFAFLDKYKDYVTFHGKYQNTDIPKLIKHVDWVIVPSTWWENSPLVIQEAFMHKRPIICSDIGGMAEKVDNNITGLHFQARNEVSLADKIKTACSDSHMWQRFVDNIGPRLSIEDCAKAHIEIYDNL